MRGGARGAWTVGAWGLAVVLAGGCRNLTLPEGEGDAGLPRLVQVSLLAPTPPDAGGAVPQRTVVRLGVESVAGLAEVELGCGGNVLAGWRPTGETQVELEREVDLGPCRPATLEGAGVAGVELQVTTVDATRLVARHGPFALPVHFAAPSDAPQPTGPLTVQLPQQGQVGAHLPLYVYVDSHAPLAEPPVVTVEGETLGVTFKETLQDGTTRYKAIHEWGLGMPSTELGASVLERTVLLQVSARAVDGTRLHTLAPLKVTRVLWERLLPGNIRRDDVVDGALAPQVLEPVATSGGLLMAVELPTGARSLVKAEGDTGVLYDLLPQGPPAGRTFLGFDSHGRPLFSNADGSAPVLEQPPASADAGTVSLGPLPAVGTWQRMGGRLCYDEVLADSRACGTYALVCLKDDGTPERLPTGMTPGSAPGYGGSSASNLLRLGFPPEAESCCVGCGSRVLFGSPEWLHPLEALEQSALGTPQEVRPDGQGGFLVAYPNTTSRWVTPAGEVKELPMTGALPLATLEGGELVMSSSSDGSPGIELRDATGKEVMKRLLLGAGFSLRASGTDGSSLQRALAYMGDGTGVSLWSRPLQDGLHEELYVLGTGWKLGDSWLYRYPSLVRLGDPVWLVPEPHGRRVYLVDFSVGRVVALVR